MENISAWLGSMDATLKTFWICAIVSTAVFAVQTILTFIGVGDADTDFDFDASDGGTMDTGGALSLFSVRSIVNFLMGFGWGGVCFDKYIGNNFLLILAAIAVGVFFVAVLMFVIRKIMKLEASGNIKMDDCVGKTCDVYLRIPASNSGKGKVQISLNGTIFEFDAVTNDAESLPTGSKVVVVENLGSSTLLVKRK